MKTLTCEWRKLAFINYIVPPEILKNHLPPHTELDFYNGNCYVSLVGFQFKNVKIAGVQVPFHSDFEEINLRFYVKRFDGNQWRHGVVFLKEIVDRPALSMIANVMLNENYRTLPTGQEIKEEPGILSVRYFWQDQENKQHLQVHSESTPSAMHEHSESNFLLHRLWGYGKQDEKTTFEYNIHHPQWLTYPVKEFSISVDFLQLGAKFSILNGATPQSVLLAEGSKVKIEGAGPLYH